MIEVSNNIKEAVKKDSFEYAEYIIVDNKKIYTKYKLFDDCYSDGNPIGTFIMKRVEFEELENNIDYKEKNIEVYKEINGTGFKIGTFIVTNIEDSDTKRLVKVTAYDYTLKFANPYVSELDYASGTITLLQVLQECCNKCGVELATTDFPNKDFIVDSNQFPNSQYGNVVMAVAGISGNFAKIGADDRLHLLLTNDTDIVIEDYEELEDKRDTHPITIVSIGVTNIEGENVTKRWEEGVELYGENYIRIDDNPFAYTEEKRLQLIDGLFEKLKGFSYSSFVSKKCFFPFLQCGDKIKIKNTEGNLIDTIVLKYESDYKDLTLEAPSLIKASVEYENPPSAYDAARNAQIIADKANNNLKLYVKREDLINEINISEEAINISGNRLIIKSDNFEMQEDGTLICNNATIRNGQLILEDDGTSNNAAISIKNTNRTYKNVEYRMDLSSSVITAVMPEDFEVPQESIDLILFASETLYYISVKCEPLGSPGFTQAYDFSFYVTNESGTYNEIFYNETLDLIENKSVVNINKELTLPDDFGVLNSGNPSDYKAYLKKVIVDAGYTYYKANGISAKIYSTLKYTNADLIRCQYLINHPSEITPEDLEFFDANGDGKLSVADMLIIMNNGGLNNFSEDKPGELILDTNASSDNLAFKDADGNVVSSVGINGINAMARSNIGEYLGKVDLVQNCTYVENLSNEIGYWLDGSVIKRRSIVLENVEFSGSNTNILGIEIEDLREVIRIYGTALNSNGTWVPINMPYGSNYVACMYSTRSGIEARSTWNWQKANIVIEYI